MAAKRKGIMDIRQILILKSKGVSNRKIAKLLGLHRNTVNEYVQLFNAYEEGYDGLLARSDSALSELFPVSDRLNKSRHEALSAFFAANKSDISRVGFTRQHWWRDYLLEHPGGYGKSQFNEHFNRWIKSTKASGKLEHKAGEKLYVDYTGKKLFYIDRQTGEQIEAEVFVGILPCIHLCRGYSKSAAR